MKHRLLALARDEGGATAVEYGMLVAFVIAVIYAALRLVGTNLNTSLMRLVF